MQQLTHQIQTKPKKHKIKKSKPYSPIRPVSKQFNNPIYAGLEEDREYLYGSGSGWNFWGVDREDRKVIQQNENNGYIRKQEHPVLQISRPHAGFSFNRTEYRNQHIPKIKKQNNQLPQIYQGTKTIVSFEPTQTPTLQDIRYKSQQNPHSTHRHLKNNFKIKILPTRHELSQRNLHLQLSRQNSQHNSIYSNQKMGRFVYNWGYDQNVDDCLLNYYKISHESLPANGRNNSNMSKQKSVNKQQNIMRKNLVKRVLEGRYRNS